MDDLFSSSHWMETVIYVQMFNAIFQFWFQLKLILQLWMKKIASDNIMNVIAYIRIKFILHTFLLAL